MLNCGARRMGICGYESGGDDERFFDTREEISSLSDSGSDGLDSSGRFVDWVSENFRYEVWIGKPGSVSERRGKFLRWMGVDNWDRGAGGEAPANPPGEVAVDVGRATETSGAVLRSPELRRSVHSSSRSSASSWSIDSQDLSEDAVLEENFLCRIRNLDDGTEFVIDGLGQDGTLSRLREVGSNRLYTADEFQQILGLSPFVQQFMRREAAAESNSAATVRRKKNGWWRRLGSVACVVDNRRTEGGGIGSEGSAWSTRVGGRRVRVRSSKKRSKEFSALYMGQEIKAHVGSIWTMKFSPDGQYLATAGEDGVVRVWKVMEFARTDEDNVLDVDPSCVYFAINGSYELVPLLADKEKIGKLNSLRKTPDLACAILPPKTFRISENPLHEFHGHTGDVLDLSWSKNQHLLSSSVDKSVRLWKVGYDGCLRVFSHSNYVTCVQFNPDDDNFFISGSIDGKVRIWDISCCQVVDWTDIKEIVTAVCYRPDGQGAILGSFSGICHFYSTSGNCLHLEDQISLKGKTKSPSRRITGFQYCPSDPTKVMVTSSDSQVRILEGLEVIGKYRGLKNAGSQISASFSSDGKHIICASEDSNVYVWNYSSSDENSSHKTKSIWSYERFFSNNASVAIFWSGVKPESPAPAGTLLSDPVLWDTSRGSENGGRCPKNSSHNFPLFPSHDHFLLGNGFFSEILPKGTATWPEEKLPISNAPTVSSAVCKSQYRFLKSSCQNAVSSPHAWGMVIVTAGWDGKIRSFLNYGLPLCL